MRIHLSVFFGLAMVAGCPASPVTPTTCGDRPVGSSFPADDGCNSCSCTAQGIIICTTQGCAVPDGGLVPGDDAGAEHGDGGRVIDGGAVATDTGIQPGGDGGPSTDAGAGETPDAGPDQPQLCGTRGAPVCPREMYCNFPLDANCGRVGAPGLCADRPRGCDDVFDPVCGCDGQTYSNACEAAASAVSVDRIGACDGQPEFGECDDDNPCVGGTYCMRAVGLCGGIGECRRPPEACAGIFAPVCGCDGETYGNACEAAAAGINVEEEQACEEGPNRNCGPNDPPCLEGFYCERPQGQCAERGECVERPEICSRELRWVCGCDGASHQNACLARQAGTSIASRGQCDDGGESPGEAGDWCNMESPCAATLYCDLPEGQCGDEGACVPRPRLCNRLLAPVCGCDGQDYNNACEANVAGTTVNYRGRCR